MKKFLNMSLVLVAAVVLFSCSKETVTYVPTTVYYTVPSTYNFDSVNYTDQKKVLLMLDQIGAEINKGNTAGTVVDAAKLKAMFGNTGGYFTDSSATLQLNTSSVRLSNLVSAAAQTDIYKIFDSIALHSQSTVAASNGVAGVATSTVNSSKKSLVSGTGIFYSQLFKKIVMGAVIIHQINDVYLADSIAASVDNSTIIGTSGLTALQHNWDAAFGYWGVPVNFPTVTAGAKYFGSYSNQVDPGLHSNAKAMNAFLKGRAAINNKDYATVAAQADTLKLTFDKMNAAAAIHELKEAQANFDLADYPSARVNLSEGIGFVLALKYNKNPKRVITDAQINEVLALFGNNLYNFDPTTDITLIRNKISTIYGFDAVKLAL